MSELEMPMVERVAKAIAAFIAPTDWEHIPSDRQAWIRRARPHPFDINGPWQADYLGMARAAIQAMRIPTDQSIIAAEEWYRKC